MTHGGVMQRVKLLVQMWKIIYHNQIKIVKYVSIWILC
jgi:hypothetical protein